MISAGCTCIKMSRTVRFRYFFIILSSLLIHLITLAGYAHANPGDEWIYGADSPVTDTHPAGQSQPDISGNIAVWSDGRPGGGAGNPARIFFKDLNNNDAEVPLVIEPGNGQSTDSQKAPAISGNLVVWLQGYPSQIHYMFLGEGCPGMAGCERTLSISGARPVRLAVSGHRIVWEDQRAGFWQADIYMYDLDNPSLGAQPVSTASSTQTQPAIDGDWVVWVDNRGGTYVNGNPTRNDIYARNVVTGEERPLTTDHQSALEQSPRISGNRVVWNINSGFNATTGGIVLYDLSSGRTRTIFDDRGIDCEPDIEGDKIVWAHRHDGTSGYEVRLHFSLA